MIKFNNSIIENAIMDALDKMEKGIEISEVDRNELINVILKGDRDFGITNGNRKYTEEELQNSVYIHIVNENNKCYVGQTSINPKRRWGFDGSGYKGQVFYNAIKYYGWDNISHVVLCHGLSEEEVNKMEIALISLFKTTNKKFSYNIENGGNEKGKISKETKEKMREAKKGENNPMYGKHPSQETKEKQREVKKGENNPFYGKHHSKETKEKMREVKKGENNPRAKVVYCDGKIFSTATDCAEYYNVSCATISKVLNGKYKTPSKLLYEFIEKGLRYATQDDIDTYPLCIEEQNQQDKQDQ